MDEVMVPDNITKQCPNRMADGRHFTDYRPRCNSMLPPTRKPMSSFELRQYLTHNAVNLMDASRAQAMRVNACAECPRKTADGTMLPEQYRTVCDQRTCATAPASKCGLGTGRAYDSMRLVGKQVRTDAFSRHAAF